MGKQIGVYLAGAMRTTPDEEQYDRAWRDVVTLEMKRYSPDVVMYNPMDRLIVHEGTTKLFDKFSTEANSIYYQDIAVIGESKIVFMNLLTLESGKTVKYRLELPDRFTLDRAPTIIEGSMQTDYPHIGTLSEVGITGILKKLFIVVAKNPAVTKHPFIRATATRVTPTLEDGIEYLQGLVGVLMGSKRE